MLTLNNLGILIKKILGGYFRFLFVVRVDLAVARLIKALPVRLRIAPTNTLGQSICSMAMAPGMVENDSLTAATRIMAPVIKASRPRIAAGFIVNSRFTSAGSWILENILRLIWLSLLREGGRLSAMLTPLGRSL